MPDLEEDRPLWMTVLQFAALVGLLIFANWGAPDRAGGFWQMIHDIKWFLAGGFLLLVIAIAGASAELTQRSLNWNTDSSGSRVLKKTCGILVILAGLYLIYITP